ncbi:MAG: aminotransferase class V-fold PLP-dependent enzyme [Rhodospirillales bacterium]|nr:aminotransferase class V-fold PLP-dependent enzyme [Rhodospirillales bacterium]
MSGIHARLGVKRRINAAGTLTRLGGSLMDETVLDAMREAARGSVDIGELQSAASRAIAAATGAEAGLVTSGAAAGLTLAAAACIAGLDVARMARLPDTRGLRNEILMPRTHRNAYDHALRAAGAVLVDIGHNDRGTGAGIRGLETWEIEAAITPATVAFAFAANPENAGDLPAVVAVCRKHGLKVIVDAAAQLPPASNLSAFVTAGADLVVFSGGKAIGGPQASGILAGERDLVASALLQQLDMDVAPARWAAPDLVDRAKVPVPPHHGIGRGFKVGKEEIVGLIVALERFVARDEAAATAVLRKRLETIAAALPDRKTRIVPGRVATLEIETTDGPRAVAALLAGDPPVHVGERDVARGMLVVDLQAVRAEDDAALAAALAMAT